MNRPDAKRPSGRWTCRLMRRLRGRGRAHLGPARSVFGCRAGPGPQRRRQTITLSGTLAGQLAFDGVRVTIPDLRMDAPEGQIVLRGFVDIGGRNPGLDLHGRLDADLARAARLIPASLIPAGASADSARIRGALELVVTARGSVASPMLDLAATGREVAYGLLQSVSISARSSVEGNRLRLHQLDVSSPAGSLQRERRDCCARNAAGTQPPCRGMDGCRRGSRAGKRRLRASRVDRHTRVGSSGAAPGLDRCKRSRRAVGARGRRFDEAATES